MTTEQRVVIKELEAATDLETIGRIVRTAARELTDSAGATFVLRDGDRCFYADEDAIAPLWKGQRFPMSDCISGWAMLHDEPAIVHDIEIDERIPIEAYRPTFVRSLVMVPMGSPPVGAIGAYWATRPGGSRTAVDRLLPLARAAGAAIARVGLADAPWAPNFSDRDGLTRS